jgi:hypothetical protein
MGKFVMGGIFLNTRRIRHFSFSFFIELVLDIDIQVNLSAIEVYYRRQFNDLKTYFEILPHENYQKCK